MYKKSISENSKYLIPFVEGIKYYGTDEIEHGIGTMMIINDKGDILTCKHIAQEFILNDKLRENYSKIVNDLSSSNKKEVEEKYHLDGDTVVLTHISLPFEIKNDVKLEIKFHKNLDLALISVDGINIDRGVYPVFSKKLPESGQSVCKLGYAFPEYNFFQYSERDNSIVLKKDMKASFPLFPMDGIVTRHIIDESGNLSMFETSTPGLRGQSGGPIFSPEGLVYGMQSMTKHIDLNFDVDINVKRGIKNKHVTYTPFINLGVGISSVEIIKFLEENKIEFKSK